MSIDSRISQLLNTTEIYLLPSLNPDGFARSYEGCGFFSRWIMGGRNGRYNSQGVDLNHDFPVDLNETTVSGGNRQPETFALIKWITSKPFVLSANLRAGEVVAVYPLEKRLRSKVWASASSEEEEEDRLTRTPDNALLK